jgi:hypothetical protein
MVSFAGVFTAAMFLVREAEGEGSGGNGGISALQEQSAWSSMEWCQQTSSSYFLVFHAC